MHRCCAESSGATESPVGKAILHTVPGVRTDIAIRAARPNDASGAVALLRAIYREGRGFVGDGPPAPANLSARIRGADRRRSLYAVAVARAGERSGPDRDEGGEAIAGWLELHRMQPSRLEHVAVLTLAVAPEHRRRGIGRRLLQRADRWANRVDLHKISLHVRAGNQPAIALYRSEGFALEGRERDQIRTDAGFEDNLIMGRFVGDPRGRRAEGASGA